VFDFNIDLWQWILSQFFALVAMSFMFYSLLTKNKVRTLLATVASNLSMTVATGLLLNWVLMSVLIVASFRDMSYLLLKKRKLPLRHPISIATLVLFLALNSTAIVLTRGEWWFNWVLFFTSNFIVFGYWLRSIHWLRISRLIACFAIIVNHLRFDNFIGIVMDTSAIISIAIFYWIYFRRKYKRLPCTESCLPNACTCGT